ncbi:hypothetical protein D3C80_929390 [compost metagenome]
MRFRSSGLTIYVKPLPNNAPKDFIGAVGDYRLSQKTPTGEIKEGEVFTLELIVSGVGNIHNSNTPKLNLPKGCSIYGDPERVEDIEFTESGAEGMITYRFNIQVLQGKDLEFQAPSISYFDPEKEKYLSIKGNPFTIQVIPDKSFNPIVASSPTAGTHTDLVDVKTTKTVTTKSTSGSKSNTRLWVSIVAPTSLLGLLFLFLMVRKRRKNEAESIQLVSSEKEVSKGPIFLNESKETPVSEVINYWKDAENALEDPGAFAILLPKAIIQRIEQCERCNFQSREKAFDRLIDTKPELAKGLREIIETCDQFRYGFGTENLETKELLDRAETLLSQLAS